MSNFDHLNLGKDDKVRKILQKHADGIYDEIILYSNRVTKINRKSKPQQRILVITDKAIYNFTPGAVKARSFSIKQFFDNPTEAPPISKRLSVHQSLKTQPQETSVGQMKRRIVLKQIHTISVSSIVNEIVLHVPNEYDYLYRVANAQDIEEIVRVLHQSSEAIKHHIKVWQFALGKLSIISDNSKSKSKGNETQKQYMQRKLKQWQKKYKVEAYDIKKCLDSPKQKKKMKKKTKRTKTQLLNINTHIARSSPYQRRGMYQNQNQNQISPNRQQRAVTNFVSPTAQPHRPSYFTSFPDKSLTPNLNTNRNHSVWAGASPYNNIHQLQQQYPPPLHQNTPLKPVHNAPSHRQVHSESFTTNPNYQMQVMQLGTMAYNQRHPQQTQPLPQQTENGNKKKKKKRRHSESSCASSYSSSSSYTGSSYSGSESASTSRSGSISSTGDYDDASATYTATECTPLPSSKTRLTPKTEAPPISFTEAELKSTHNEKKDAQDDEESNHRHNLNIMRKRKQRSRSHNRYAQTEVLQSNINAFTQSKQMPTRPLPANGNSNSNPNPNNMKQPIQLVSTIIEAKGLPVTNKEAYLPDHLFWQVFQMRKDQFYALRQWKQKKMKRDTGFF